MDNRKMRRILFTVISGCFGFLFSVAQPVVKTIADKNEVLIGQQFAVKVQAVFSGEDYYIKWITVPDSIRHFELVEKSKIDSVFTNQKLSGLSQTFTLTSFDSGKWIFPSFKISFSPVKDDTTLNIFTDSIPVTVSYSVADTTSTLKDIKAIRQVEVFSEFWYWVAGGLLMLLIVSLIIWWYRRNKKSVKLPPFPSKVSPYEEAMQELVKLKIFNLFVPKEVQQYHNRLTEIFRYYLSRKENADYLNKTTSDILINLKNGYLDKNITDKAAAALRFSNAVKFAKYIPPVADNEANQQLVKETIDLIESATIKNKL